MNMPPSRRPFQDGFQPVVAMQQQASMNQARSSPQEPQTIAAINQMAQSVSNQQSQQQQQASQLAMAHKDSLKMGPVQSGQLEGTAGIFDMVAQVAQGLDPRIPATTDRRLVPLIKAGLIGAGA